jgi:hypothetical protein
MGRETHRDVEAMVELLAERVPRGAHAPLRRRGHVHRQLALHRASGARRHGHSDGRTMDWRGMVRMPSSLRPVSGDSGFTCPVRQHAGEGGTAERVGPTSDLGAVPTRIRAWMCHGRLRSSTSAAAAVSARHRRERERERERERVGGTHTAAACGSSPGCATRAWARSTWACPGPRALSPCGPGTRAHGLPPV